MIKISNLKKSYSKGLNEIVVLDKLNLNILENESVAILGDSGSGKTTLLSLIGGLEAASSGSISIGGSSLETMNQKELTRFRASKMGIIFQQYHLMDYLTALENIMLPLEINNEPDAYAKAMKMLEEVGLKDRGDHLPSQLSGGECQRVALARALVIHPTILLADEPTGSLDSGNGRHVMDLLFKLKKEHGTTLVLVTHNEALASRCDRTLKMEDGKLI